MRNVYGLLSLLALAVLVNNLPAQTTTTGAFGTRTLGNGVSTNTSNFSANSGRTPTTQASNGLGIGQTAGNSLSQNFSLSSTGTRQGQGQFVGADRMDSSNTFSQQAASQQLQQNNAGQTAFIRQLTQQMQRGQNQLQQLNRAGQGQGGQNQPQLRIPVKVGFTASSATSVSTRATAQLTKRFANLPGLQATSPIVVQMEGETAVLTGQVASASDRDLATQIAKMEPGIEAVRNELTVGPAATKGAGSNRVQP